MFSYISDFISLIFPRQCSSCGNPLENTEDIICSSCIMSLPYTNFYLQENNIIEKQFWGRGNVFSAASCLYFKKKNNVQKLLHELKYKGNQDVGIKIGKIFGNQLKGSYRFNTISVIIPIPLHPDKLKKRGYNQSECFAKGLADVLGASIDVLSVTKNIANSSQTNKKRYERSENTENVFVLSENHNLANKHVLIVDDVITTGATIESCIRCIENIPNIKISVASIAYTE